MNFRYRSTVSVIVTSVIAIVLLYVLFQTNGADLDWFPQTVVTLAALVGASWFSGHRLDLFDKDITQRQAFADEKLKATERANFNGAAKEAVKMMAEDETSSVLAGQRWLHAIANVGPTEANLVQSLLCNHLTGAPDAKTPTIPTDPLVRSRQSALNLLFRTPGSQRFADCDDGPDLRSTHWRALNFTDLDLRGGTFAESDFTNAVAVGSCFEACNLRETRWSDIGGDTRTSMKKAELCGAIASSATFTNVDFTGTNLSNNGRRTHFQVCTFVECDFTSSDWTGATFKNCKFIQCNFEDAIWKGVTLDTPQFEHCPSATLDLCSEAKLLKDPAGLSSDVVEGLRRMGLNDSLSEPSPS